MTAVLALNAPAVGLWNLKSEIARPRVYETLPPNQIYTICDAAWAGETDVTEIAVSTDGGQTWANAEFLDPVRRHAWRRWKFDWLTPKKSGQYTLLSRAKDASGVKRDATRHVRRRPNSLLVRFND